MSAAVQLAGVSKRLSPEWALQAIDLEVAPGELFVLVGPSGSGKSTLVRLVAGLLAPDSGDILIAGSSVRDVAPELRNVSMVFQNYALFPHLDCRRNIGFGLEARGVPPDEVRAKVDEVAAKVGLTSLVDRYPRELSGGERQRVALARALVRSPRVFLLDEPLANLDAQLRTRTRAELQALLRDLGTATLYVTHDQAEALTMGHRIGVLRAGRLEQVGTPRDIYDRPATAFVATFVGSPPMNTFTVDASPAGLSWGAHRLPLPEGFVGELGPLSRPLTLGVRPEHVYVRGSSRAAADFPGEPVSATVELVELMGDQALCSLCVEQTRLVARVEPELELRRGDTTQLWLDTRRVHLFEPADGRTLMAWRR